MSSPIRGDSLSVDSDGTVSDGSDTSVVVDSSSGRLETADSDACAEEMARVRVGLRENDGKEGEVSFTTLSEGQTMYERNEPGSKRGWLRAFPPGSPFALDEKKTERTRSEETSDKTRTEAELTRQTSENLRTGERSVNEESNVGFRDELSDHLGSEEEMVWI